MNDLFSSGVDMYKKLGVFAVFLTIGPVTVIADQDSPEWVQSQIADVLRAAPLTVTQNAKIYAFHDNGERVLVRDGDGPYTCVASGSNSLRVGVASL